tara:strand:+ start:298 stop:921 length:624 start_codon:yes stop_codon:yes gene_type:complete
MSCGVPQEVRDLVDQLSVFKKGPIGILDLLPVPIPTTGAGLIEMAKTTGEYATIIAEIDKIKAKVKAALPIIGVVQGLQPDIEDVVGRILTAKVAGEDLANELKNLKTKYTGIDLGDLDIEDIPSLLENGIIDLENLCKKIPNFENDGVNISFRGLPISFPSVSPQSLLATGKLPSIPKPKITVDVTRRKKAAGESFINIDKPRLFD